MNLHDVDLSTLAYRSFSPDERDAVRREAVRQANAARDAALEAALRGLAAGLCGLPAKFARAVTRAYRSCRARRRRRMEIALLRGLSDYELKDISLTRFDIEMLAHLRSGTMTRE